VVARGPWREVRYSLQASGELLRLQPEETVDRTFAVEASLPSRDGWIRVALAPGNWIVALGWTMDFNVLTLDGRVLFRGRHPYDEVEYDLPDGVHLAFWCGYYALDLRGSLSPIDIPGEVGLTLPERFDPRWQYEHGVFYGYCTVLEVRTREPLILEFKAPEPGARLYGVLVPKLVTDEYISRHTPWWKGIYLPVLPIPPVSRKRGRHG
jgi:hypothetical protein